MTISGAYCRRNTIGVDKEEERAVWRGRSVEFRMPDGRSVRVDCDRMAVLGMTKCPEVVDATRINGPTSKILEQILTGNVSTRVSMRQAAELAHVATELKFKSLLKLMEADLLRQTPTSMPEAVDSLCFAVRFGMTEAVGKLVDDIVFSYLDEDFVMYCKSELAMDLVMNRKASLMAEQDTPENLPVLIPPPQPMFPNATVALPIQRQNQQYHKVFVNAAKEKFRAMMARPVNAFRNGIEWMNRRRPAPPAQHGFQNFHDQFG